MAAARFFSLGPALDYGARSHAWVVSGTGPAGARVRRFAVSALGAPAPAAPGVYMFVRRQSDGVCVPLYAGESAGIDARLIGHESMADAILIGANELHVLTERGGAAARRLLAGRLIALYDPVLNRPAGREAARAAG